MNKNIDCRFCDIWNGIYANPTFDKPIFKNEQYMSIVSIGAFIEGWTLVVPKEHTYSMREFYTNTDFSSFVSHIANHIKSIYKKPIIAFEHGANRCDSKTSCGTHHAHLHIVPYDKSLLPSIIADRVWHKATPTQIQTIVGENEYLLYFDFNDSLEASEFYVHILSEEESQYFRKILAADANISDFSYKTAPYINKTEKSYDKLKGNIE